MTIILKNQVILTSVSSWQVQKYEDSRKKAFTKILLQKSKKTLSH